GAAGYVSPGVSVEVVDQRGQLLPAGREGAIRIRSSLAAKYYVGDEQASSKAFCDGCFNSGDIGYVTADRLLVITGREKTILNLGGESVNPETIETRLRTYAGIDDAAVVGIHNELGIAEVCALIVTKPDVDEATLAAYCKAQMPE